MTKEKARDAERELNLLSAVRIHSEDKMTISPFGIRAGHTGMGCLRLPLEITSLLDLR
jgi:hypothetical protein